MYRRVVNLRFLLLSTCAIAACKPGPEGTATAEQTPDGYVRIRLQADQNVQLLTYNIFVPKRACPKKPEGETVDELPEMVSIDTFLRSLIVK